MLTILNNKSISTDKYTLYIYRGIFMGLLDRAINIAQKAYDRVVGNDDTAKSAQAVSNPADSNASKAAKNSNNPNSVQNPEGKTVGTVGDTLEVSSKASEMKKSPDKIYKSTNRVSKPNSDRFKKQSSDSLKEAAIKKVKDKIKNKCILFGISFEEAESKILSQMEFSFEEFKSLSKDEQLAVLLSIDSALGLYIVNNNKKKVHSTADKAAVIGQTAKNIKDATELGGVKDVNEFSNEVGDINKELDGKINNNTTEEEYAKILSDSRKSFEYSLELKRKAEIRKCNGDQERIDEVNRRYDARLRAFERQRQTEFASAVGSKKAHMSVYLRSGKDFSDAHVVALNTYSGKEQTAVADSFTHDFEVNAKRRYYEAGDSISSEEYGKAVLYITQLKSAEALKQFQADAYEFRKKVESGEVDAPYMSEEDFTQETAAIGVGIVKNTNITDSEKKFLLSKWHNNITNFKDYEKVIRQVAPGIKDFDNSVTEILKVFGTEQFVKDSPAYKIVERVSGKKATPQQIQQALTVMSYEQARHTFNKNSDRDFVEVILHDPKLKGHKQNIVGYIKTLSADDLSDITEGCSTEMFLFVLRNISPDKAGRLYDLSKGEKCYAARKLGEKIVEENKANEAA